MTEIIKVNQINPEMDKIDRAAAVIRSGGLVVFPTETVYGIGADAFNGSACREVFRVKNRPADNPLIVHISKMEQLDRIAEDVPEDVRSALKTLWPGPVTFRLKKRKEVPSETTAGLDTASVRMPAHPIALRLIDRSGTPIAAPSANISTKPSGTRAEHVIKDFEGKVEAILDGGDTLFGLESTIIDATVKPYLLLRPGAFTIEELRKYLDVQVPESLNTNKKIGKPVAPGMKYRHYAPDTELLLVSKEFIKEAARSLSGKVDYAVICSNETAETMDTQMNIIRLGSEGNLYEIAKNLFDSFRKLDTLGVKLALIQTFPEKGIGLALMNRMMKASDSKVVNSIDELDRRIAVEDKK